MSCYTTQITIVIRTGLSFAQNKRNKLRTTSAKEQGLKFSISKQIFAVNVSTKLQQMKRN